MLNEVSKFLRKAVEKGHDNEREELHHSCGLVYLNIFRICHGTLNFCNRIIQFNVLNFFMELVV